MKKNILAGFAVSLVFTAVGFAAAQNQGSIRGRVTASQIASVGSVGTFEKRLNCHGEADCAARLVAAGGKYVLVTTKGVYSLSDQTKAAQFVTREVTVAGNVNEAKKTVEVADVQVYNPSATSAGLQ